MAEWVFVALGSNLGDRQAYLAFARDRLAKLPRTQLIAESAIEETEPIGPIAQGPFLNQMVLLKTELEARELLEACLEIERAAGRERRVKWGPRTLDIDIVRYGELMVREPDLALPHPELENRPFWQRELAELEEHVRVP